MSTTQPRRANTRRTAAVLISYLLYPAGKSAEVAESWDKAYGVERYGYGKEPGHRDAVFVEDLDACPPAPIFLQKTNFDKDSESSYICHSVWQVRCTTPARSL